MKTCTECNQDKSLKDFYSHPRINKTTGVSFTYTFPYCKECNSEKKRKLDRTRDGIVHTLYTSQVLHSKKRGHPAPTYTEAELKKWLHTHPKFEILFEQWETSGFDSKQKPSCNRLDDYAGYSLTNIELLTWRENNLAWARDSVAGKNRKISRPIQQFTLKGEFITEYISIQDASRKTNIAHSNIIKTCTGVRNAAGGFIWKYSDPRSPTKCTGFVGGA